MKNFEPGPTRSSFAEVGRVKNLRIVMVALDWVAKRDVMCSGPFPKRQLWLFAMSLPSRVLPAHVEICAMPEMDGVLCDQQPTT